jgi:hypothetical protein
MNKELALLLKQKLENRYENTSLEMLGNSTNPDECKDFTLYVYFNDSFDNCLAVYSDGNVFAISNYQNLRSDLIKPSTEFSRKTSAKCVDELVSFFHECYKQMFKREAEKEAQHKACLNVWKIDENIHEKIEGPTKRIGKLINS